MTNVDPDVSIDEVHKQFERNRKALLILLDQERSKRDHQFGLSSRMGSSRSFVTSVSLGWAAQHIRFASDLPIFREWRDEFGVIQANKKTQHMIQQRNPDWRRQLPMTLYLAGRKTHKFPPMLVVVTQPWVDDQTSDEWGPNGRALNDSIDYTGLDSEGYFVDLSFEQGSFLYAIDGQHRLMAIKGLQDLLDTGRIDARQESGKFRTSGGYSIDEIIEASRGEMTRTDLQGLMDERIGVELLPAVMRGEAHKEALRRLRSIFVHVNRTAKPLTKGELALLDEDNGFAVVARMVMVEHPLLEERVRIRKGQLSESSDEITTLETLQHMSQAFLAPLFPGWEPDKKAHLPMRPEEEDLDEGFQHFYKFLDLVRRLPSMQEVLLGASPAEFRRTGDEGPGHLLFRPLGQLALAGAVADLTGDGLVEEDEIFDKLTRAELDGRLKIDEVTQPWFGVVWDPVGGKMRRQASSTKLCHRLMVHLLGGGTSDAQSREELQSDFAQARVDSADDTMSRDLSGDLVPLAQVKLPVPW